MKWLWIALALLFALFMTWHEWRGPPLTPQETEAVLADLAAHRRTGNSGDHDVLQDLRRLAANDDGGEYFMVNLIRYRERAEYPRGFEALGTDARAADDRYSAIVVPQLLARGSYPIYVSDVAGAFIDYPGAEKWDAVAIVRYRSRRDMLDMVRALQQLDGGVHKWAAIANTQVFPTQANIRIAPLPLLVALVLLLVGVTGQLALRHRAGVGGASPNG